MEFSRRVHRIVALFLAALLLSSQALASSHTRSQKHAAVSKYRGDVILLRGFGGAFSTGMDKIAKMLIKRRIKARVMSHNQWRNAGRAIVANQKKFGSKPVIVVGHSWGGNAAIKLAQMLKRERISVTYMVTFDATSPKPAPSNVRRLTNFYSKDRGWGVPVKRGAGFRGVLKNVDLSNDRKIHHTNIDDRPKLQNQVVRNILRFLAGSGRG